MRVSPPQAMRPSLSLSLSSLRLPAAALLQRPPSPSSPLLPLPPRRAVRALSSPGGSPEEASFGSRMEESVRKTLADNPVVIYSKSWCSYSMEVKALFNRIGLEPHVVELDQLGPQGPQLQKVLERLTGQSTVPNVFIGGKHIGGCTDTVKLYRKGELTTMLSELNIDVKNLQQP